MGEARGKAGVLFSSNVFEEHPSLPNVELPDNLSPKEVRNNKASTK